MRASHVIIWLMRAEISEINNSMLDIARSGIPRSPLELEISPEKTLKQQGFDSLDSVEFTMALEERWKIQVSDMLGARFWEELKTSEIGPELQELINAEAP